MALCGADTLCRWAAQGLEGRSRAWRTAAGTAVAVAGPALATRDRLALHGQPAAVTPLAREVLAAVGPSYRPVGNRELIDALVAVTPGLESVGSFGWMYRWRSASLPARPARARWLTDDAMPEVAVVLQSSLPESRAKPGGAGVHRWAGIRDEEGRLVATGTIAWSAPDVAVLAGVAVQPDARGRGMGRDICAFLLAEALASHAAAALMVEEWNRVARRIYAGLGMRYRPVAAARYGHHEQR